GELIANGAVLPIVLPTLASEVLMGSTPAFTTDRIRNVVLLGHGGAGKTTLIDACCHASGSSRRHGSSDDGTALTMYAPEEIDHGISMNCSVAYAEWM